MEKLSKILMAIDAFKSQFSSKNKKHADDYYELVSAVSDRVLKMNDGGMVSVFQMKGFSRTLNNIEKRAVSKRIEKELYGYLIKPGFTMQIVELSDPELSPQLVQESMSESIDELKRMGIGHSMFTSDYVKYISERSIWKEQFMVVYTSPIAVRDMPRKNKTKEKIEENADKELIMKEVLRENVTKQGVFLSDTEKDVYDLHKDFCNKLYSSLSINNAIIMPMLVEDALRLQKKSLYGNAVEPSWKPTLGAIHGERDNHDGTGKIKFKEASLVEQIISVGGTEEDLPQEVVRFGERFFTTLSLTIPQDNDEDLENYLSLAGNFGRDVGYISSFRIETDPFSNSSYRIEKAYAGVSAIIPMTDNSIIIRSHNNLKESVNRKEKVGVYLEMTLTLFSKDLDKLIRTRNRSLNAIASWGGAQFRSVELDKTQGLFDTLPGFSKKSNLKQVLENFADAIYQSPLFAEGILYDSGYLHFFTETGQPFPVEEHSALNINFNSYFTGTSGSGKSTLLTLFNLALLAKPKLNPKLRGEYPVIFDVDFGKTSFGFKDTIRSLIGEKKKNMFLIHEMTTGIESAYNPHDLTFGRLKPTQRQKEVLTRFLLVLLCGVEENAGKFKVKNPEMESMISYMVDIVYDNCLEGNNPKLFQSAEFTHKSTLEYLKSIGITCNSDTSYYYLSDLVMEKDPKRGYAHAMLLRRYGYPRLSDYGSVLTERTEVADRFSQGTVTSGLSPKDYFIQRMAEVSNEYPCFTRVTKINVDFARMISIDIKNVCGESDYRKAVFGSMCLMMFLVKRENLEESPDLLSGVKSQYHDYIKRLSSLNIVLPASLNIEEAHVLFALFDKSMIENQRQNRKANWGIRALSQNLQDPSDDFFSLCSTVVIASEQTDDAAIKRMNTMNASQRERSIIQNDLNNRTIFLYVKTKPSPSGVNVSRIATPLKAHFSPGLIWASNSDQTDISFKNAVLEKLGTDVGFRRLSAFFTSGNVKGLLSDKKRLGKLAAQSGFTDNFAFLLSEIVKSEVPSKILRDYL